MSDEFGYAAVKVILLITAVVVVVVFIVYDRRRRVALAYRAAIVARLGWSLAPPDPWLVTVATRLGVPGQPARMFTGDFDGRRLFVIDFELTPTDGEGLAHLIGLTLPGKLPPLTVSPDVRLERLLGQDIELESQAFNDTFRVQGYSGRFASAVLQPRLMEWMLHNSRLRWHIAGNILVTWELFELTMPEVMARLETMAGVIDRIPRFVFRDDWTVA
ncbi:hypothetical protein ACFTSF_16480 [Kribbella sp. NPDC056951]|uniref:hypothetical protein n=1 Tax=Kribbella sp. NPDC056951 TaxID=3345978 RepID=UPI003625C9D2